MNYYYIVNLFRLLLWHKQSVTIPNVGEEEEEEEDERKRRRRRGGGGGVHSFFLFYYIDGFFHLKHSKQWKDAVPTREVCYFILILFFFEKMKKIVFFLTKLPAQMLINQDHRCAALQEHCQNCRLTIQISISKKHNL